MSDLISRKALMKYMRDYKWEFALNSDFSKAIEMVDVQPTVEAKEVVHGEFKLAFSEEENVWECSNCGKHWLLNDGTPFDNEMYFCPKCGMRTSAE